MSRRLVLVGSILLVLSGAVVRAAEVVWTVGDDRPIPEPAVDHASDQLWRDGAWTTTVYQLRRWLDPHTVGSRLHLARPREAADVNALDEVPDSTWFTNRQGRRRRSPAELVAIAQRGRPPSEDGPLQVTSIKSHGVTPGFLLQDAKGDRYLVKLDPPGYPDVPTGAEMVCTSILWALGWNVPENHLVRLDPARLTAAPGTDLAVVIAHAGHLPDGRLRAVASRLIPGVPKGGFRTVGRRPDDPNDTVPHQDRRELRGLRVVAAWLNYTDARRGNFYDSFVVDPARADRAGHLVHYILDFSSALGAGNDDWKSPRYGHEYVFDPSTTLARVLTLGVVSPSWAHVPLAHPALGYLDAASFDPVDWRTTYPNPLFDAATVRDAFWGAKLVASLGDADLRLLARAGEWTDPRAADVLADILAARARKIAATYFDWRRIDPIDGFRVEGGVLRFRDLAVETGVADPARVVHRARSDGGPWRTLSELAVPLDPASAPTTVELATSHDGGAHWSPPTRVTIERGPDGVVAVTAIDRGTA